VIFGWIFLVFIAAHIFFLAYDLSVCLEAY